MSLSELIYGTNDGKKCMNNNNIVSPRLSIKIHYK